MRKTLLPLLALSALTAGAVTSGCFGGSTPLDVPPPNIIDDGDDKKPLEAGSMPAIQGGTLLVLDDGVTALAADPARDQLFFADLQAHKLIATVDLQEGDQPGRAVQDASGTVHVALRRGGAIVSVTPTGKLLSRREVCPAPSGIAYDANDDTLHVACSTGELVSLAAAGGGVTRTLHLSPDLRDVVVYQGNASGVHLLVSRFREADVLVLDQDGALVRTVSLPDTFDMVMQPVKPTVAWRMRGLPDGRVFMLHQRSLVGEIPEEEGGYSGEMCGGPVVTVVSEIDPALEMMPEPEMAVPGSLTTDFEYASHDEQFVMAATGFSWMDGMPRLIVAWDIPDPIGCNFSVAPELFGEADGEITAVAYDGNQRWIAQSREPAMLITQTGERISLSSESRYDEGLALFHKAPMAAVTCASCHPAGGDDGHVWVFSKSGARRTQTLAGTLAGTAPYHWDASMDTLNTIMDEVFVDRMLGEPLVPWQQAAFAEWLEGLPAPPTPIVTDKDAVARGKQLFEDKQVGCASCHAGDMLTNNKSYDVGTGGIFQVPSLIGVGSRTTFMHDGCAPTLADRFAPGCGGDTHGDISQLDAGQLADLVAYMQTL